MFGPVDGILLHQCRLDKEKPIVVGVSGGTDSVCLLSVLHEAGWRVIAAHFNHLLRAEAAEEAKAVERLAQQLRVPFAKGEGDVRRHAEEKKLSIESAARELRYRFLFGTAHKHGAQAVAVGHTADDQIETVLMHFIRGAGLNGLRGMPYRAVLPEFDAEIPVVRPLLDTWRGQTVAYCKEHNLVTHYDISNDSTDFLRNRLRHELIPILEGYNPQFREAVWRSGKALAADHEMLMGALEPVWQRTVVRQGRQFVGLDAAVLRGQPAGVRMQMFRRAARLLIPGADVGYADLQRAAEFAENTAQERADFTGGLLLLREREVLYVADRDADLPSDQWPQMPMGLDSISLSIPIQLALADGWQFTADRCGIAELESASAWEEADPFHAYLDARDLPEELELRVRRAGDRFEPLGMEGHSQKISDFFVNEKVPARRRGRWPLVCSQGNVLWVPGYRPAEAYRVRPDTQEVLRLVIAAG